MKNLLYLDSFPNIVSLGVDGLGVQAVEIVEIPLVLEVGI